jgi:predicted TIM-barrel fold metal-dependent hydrolase
MEKLNIHKSIISISSPGTYLVKEYDAFARELTRRCNDYAAEVVSRYPSSLGFWASLPLPDVEGALQEIPYIFDTLKADGVTLETNSHGQYLGDSCLDVVFDELNRRCAKVFIHPTTPCIKSCHAYGPTPAAPLSHFPNPMFEFMFDSARAVINLFLSGTIARCPNITFIIPHAGGALPPLIERFTSFAAIIGGDRSLTSKVVKDTFAKQFYFDLAGFPFPDQIWGLLRYVGTDRLLYGSDYPFTPADAAVELAEVMTAEMEEIWDEEDTRAVLFGNARRLLGSDKRRRLGINKSKL